MSDSEDAGLQDAAVSGSVDERFAETVEVLERQIRQGQHLGGALCVYHEGKPVVDVVFGSRDEQGSPWQSDTMAVAFSTTKGIASLAVHILADRGQLAYDDPVARYWPGFGRNGKERITIRQVLCHEAGLHHIRDYVSDPSEIMDWDHMVGIVEGMTPAFEPGTQNAYHATSYSWLVGELVRRVSGQTIGEFVQEHIARPLGLDGCYIGLPRLEFPRLARLTLEAPSRGEGGLVEGASPEARAEGIRTIAPGFERILANDLEVLTVPLAAGNGVFTARSLARAYAAMLDAPEGAERALVSRETLAKAAEPQNSRVDLVIGLPIGWRLGYHSIFTTAGPLPHAIGHFGFGGSGAFVDIETELSVALLVNKLSTSMIGNMRLAEIAAAAVKCARR